MPLSVRERNTVLKDCGNDILCLVKKKVVCKSQKFIIVFNADCLGSDAQRYHNIVMMIFRIACLEIIRLLEIVIQSASKNICPLDRPCFEVCATAIFVFFRVYINRKILKNGLSLGRKVLDKPYFGPF